MTAVEQLVRFVGYPEIDPNVLLRHSEIYFLIFILHGKIGRHRRSAFGLSRRGTEIAIRKANQVVVEELGLLGGIFILHNAVPAEFTTGNRDVEHTGRPTLSLFGAPLSEYTHRSDVPMCIYLFSSPSLE